jgi:hypothetical protein
VLSLGLRYCYSVIRPLTGRAGNSSSVSYGSKLSSRLRNPSEQVGEHHSGVWGCLASEGRVGTVAGWIGALGGNDFGTTLQAVSSTASAGSVSRRSADLSLGIGLHLRVLGSPAGFQGSRGFAGGKGFGRQFLALLSPFCAFCGQCGAHPLFGSLGDVDFPRKHAGHYR